MVLADSGLPWPGTSSPVGALLFMAFWKGWLEVVKPPAAVAVKR